jgi:hypothetical protein
MLGITNVKIIWQIKEELMINTVARLLVMFFRKHNLKIKSTWLYNLYYTEYKVKKSIPDYEVSHAGETYEHTLTVDYSFNGIQLDLNDLPWFLTRNRYIINKNIKGPWYFYNMQYFFKSSEDCDVVKKRLLGVVYRF